MTHNEEFAKQLAQWRHQIHENPEAAFEEEKTSAFVAEKLRQLSYDVHTGIGKTGIVANMTCGTSKKVIGLRADMDCICITEEGEHPYTSKTPKRMHACGHDGHTITLLGAAELIAKNRDFNGTVRLVFQPAEEPGKGAQAMMEDGIFEKFPIDEFYSLHNWPGDPEGTFHMRTGGFMASEDNFEIKIHGHGGHASSPHFTVDPMVIAAQIVMGLQTIVSRNENPVDPTVVSCTEIFSDGVHNTIPSTITILGDTRSTTPEAQKIIEQRMREICENTCRAYNAECEFKYTHEFVPLVNNEACVKKAAEAAAKVVGGENVDTNSKPVMASEDFARFIEKVPGCYMLIGGKKPDQKEVYSCHNPHFDYNDNNLETGAWYFYEVVRTCLPADK